MADFPTTVPGPSYPIDKQAEPRVKKVTFGDGYTQQTADGINSLLYTWNLNWDVLTASEKDTIEAFFIARGGYETFNWTDPGGTTFKVKCPNWSVNNFEPSIWKITATFKQSPI
jgi:phage-related protein